MAAVLPTYLTLFGGSYFSLTSGTANATIRVNGAGDAFEQVTVYSRSETDSILGSYATTSAVNAKLANTSDSFSGTLSFLDGGDNTTASINSTTGVGQFTGLGTTPLALANATGTLANARTTATSANTNSAIMARDESGRVGISRLFNANNATVTIQDSLSFTNVTTPAATLAACNWSPSSQVGVAVNINPTDSTTGTGGLTALKVNLAGSGTGSGAKRLLDLQKAGTSKVFVTSLGSSVFSDAAISTSATDGFVYFPSCAGTPSGTPTTQTGTVAMVYDTSANKFWAYNGSWRSVTLA